MASTYVIWRSNAPSSVGGFQTEREALAAVRQAVETQGMQAVAGWSLVRVPESDESGDWQTMAEGADLAELARARLAPNGGGTPRSAPRNGAAVPRVTEPA